MNKKIEFVKNFEHQQKMFAYDIDMSQTYSMFSDSSIFRSFALKKKVISNLLSH